MIRGLTEPSKLTIRLADEDQRRAIYRMRHEVYARELGQHAVNEAGQLVDDLDAFNHYIAASDGDQLVGFVSVTPPRDGDTTRYSIDKYVTRDRLPFVFDASVYEVRLLTVVPDHRHSHAAGLLMWAALRWIEARGGRWIVGIGRHEVMELYRKVGLEPTGVVVRSGQVSFELMYADVHALRRTADHYDARLRRLSHRVDWQLDAPFEMLSINAQDDECYHGGAFFDAIGPRFETLDRRRAIINADVLDAWFDPSPRVVQAVREHLPWLMRTSPPTGCEGLIETIARRRGVDPACVLPGGGSSDLIYLALRHWLAPESRVLILDPMYGEYAHVLEKVIGCEVDRFTLRPSDQYAINLEKLAGKLHVEQYDLLIMVNPNSPTGQFIGRSAMAKLLGAVPGRTRVWVDETYIEYAGADQSLEPHAAASGNVIVCKSMSKVYALSGMRAAYLVGPRSIVRELRRHSPPWAVSLPGQVAAVAALEDEAYYRARWRHTHLLREQLSRTLTQRLGWRVNPGVANFLLCHLPADGPTASKLVAACRADGLFIRDASNMGRVLGVRAVRLAVKDPSTNRRMVQTMIRHAAREAPAC